MQVLKAVIVELWQFVLYELGLGTASASTLISTTTAAAPELTAIVEKPLLLPGSDVALNANPYSDISQDKPKPTAATETVVSGEGYVQYPETPCYLRPGRALDTMIGSLSYGTSVTIVSRREEWLQIRSDALEGWVEAVGVTSDKSVVFPTLVAEEQYDANHPETLKLRTYINDEFGGGVARMALLSCEYVWYRLLDSGRDFSWPLSRPRTAGRWADILQGTPSVHVGSVPLTGGVMEYLDEVNEAQLFYVTAVRPDEAVVVSGVLPDPAGIYCEKTIASPEWHALGARFINKK